MDEIDETLPEVVQNFLRSGAKLQEIRLNDRGRWTHEGLDFENPRIIDLFNRSVSRTPGGTWVLEIGRFTYPIEVDDTGFFVERIEFGEPPILELSDGTSEPLDPTSLEYAGDGRLYTTVKDGAFRARLKKPAYYALAERMTDTDEGWDLELNGERFAVAPPGS
jgi:hypothetical protein